MASMALEQLKARNVIPNVVEAISENLDMRVSYGKNLEKLNGRKLLLKQSQGKLHWLVANISGSVAPSEEIWDKGKEVPVAHNGPSPPAGVHRCVFLLFTQEDNVDIKRAPDRKQFSVQDFARKYKLGIPVAATLFTAEHGDD